VSIDFEACKYCNDGGDGGLCTCCGRLHTVTIVRACLLCMNPVDISHVTGQQFILCPPCRRKGRAPE